MKKKTSERKGFELMPTEILFCVVNCLQKRDIKEFSCVSKRARDVCLPFLFREVSIDFSSAGFRKLDKMLHSHICRYIVSFQYIVQDLVKPGKIPLRKQYAQKANLKPAIYNYERFKTDFLTPEYYVEMCEGYDNVDCYEDIDSNEDWEEMEYPGGDHPSYTRIYKTMRRRCVEQRSLIDTGRDSKFLKKAFKKFLNLKELELVFRGIQGASWEKDYQETCDMMAQDSNVHHLKVVLAALVSAERRGLSLQKIQLTCLTHRDDPSPGSPDWQRLTTLLTELVGHAPVLRLFGSDLALALLSRASLNLRELDLGFIHTKRTFVETFLQNNVKSLRFLKFDDIVVEDCDRRDSTHVTLTDVRDMTDLVPEKEINFNIPSCSHLVQEGRKFIFIYASRVPASRTWKRKWNDSI
ncbi:hypothetical protein N7481_003483 [Penicillium waksmanii]|uniref:uncharacterized protein n=1 Tax=Penicillium waksmanii TaxID=69791 RepID=UPI0025485468|nr:uncharacterized protein N7481_003483 [Penicillium waksmanii]KAJ5988273.1 hypothetical protein N7481_003483 [Penicillium waksmanii]